MSKKTVAVVGATGAVGQEMIKILEERNFPVKELRPLASERSVGKNVTFNGENISVRELMPHHFSGCDIALFSAGGSISEKFAPIAVDEGCYVVDNSSAFRMDENTPLVVPEINPETIPTKPSIIANPNCSTIQMAVALWPLHRKAVIKRIIVATYQAVSGAGFKASKELFDETRAILNGEEYSRNIFPHQIAFNAIPQIPQSNAFLENGYTTEEMKMINETRKIFNDYNIQISATTVRIPVDRGHSESVNVEFASKISPEEARSILKNAPGIELLDEISKEIYPLATIAAGTDPVYVGRIRKDLSCANGLEMWIVSDNLRKGAALNAIQIAEKLI